MKDVTEGWMWCGTHSSGGPATGCSRLCTGSGFRVRGSCCCLEAKQRLEPLVHFQTGSSSSPAPPPSNAPVGHLYSEGGNMADQPGRSSSEYSRVIGSRHRKSKLVATRLRLPSNAIRAGIIQLQQGGASVHAPV